MRWCILALTAAAALGQQPSFRSRSDEVLIPVSVTTRHGQPVDGLRADDFVVLSDGAQQKVRLTSSLEAAPLPIDAVIVLQTDEGSGPALAKISKTASLVATYVTNDMGLRTPSLAAVVTVSDEVKLVQDFTPDGNVLDNVLWKIKPDGDGNRMVDAVSLACDLLAARNEPARRMVVVISGPKDSGSKASIPEVAFKAQKDQVAIYTISYSGFTTAFTQKASERAVADEPGVYDPSNHGGSVPLGLIFTGFRWLGKANASEALANATGGSHSKFTTLRGLEEDLSLIGTEVHDRYVLSFVPPVGQSEGFHKVSVTLPGRKEVEIHARPGYWVGAK